MALTHVNLLSGLVAQLASSAGVIYDNPNATKTYIKGIYLFNTSTTTSQTVKLYIVPNNGAGAVGTAATGNRVLQYTLAPLEALDREFVGLGYVLMAEHDSLQAEATSATTVTISLSGDLDQ
jgi:hypothetical protein